MTARDSSNDQHESSANVRATNQDPDNIPRIHGNGFQTNYRKGDVAEALAWEKISEVDRLIPVRSGIDMREYRDAVVREEGVTDLRIYALKQDPEDTPDEAIERFQYVWERRMELIGKRATEDGTTEFEEECLDRAEAEIEEYEDKYFTPVSNVEIKCKTSLKWMGRINKSHHRKFLDLAQTDAEDGISTAVWFFLYERGDSLDEMGDLRWNSLIELDPDQSAETDDDILESDQVEEIVWGDDYDHINQDVVQYDEGGYYEWPHYLYTLFEACEYLEVPN